MTGVSHTYSQDRSEGLLIFLFEKAGIDASKERSLELYSSLNFEIEYDLDVVPLNENVDGQSIHDLNNFVFVLRTASKELIVEAESEDKSYECLTLRIGFERVRIAILGDELRLYSNYICGMESDDEDEPGEPTHRGRFKMTAARTRVEWTVEPKRAGTLMNGHVLADKLCSVSVAKNSAIETIVSVARDALKVRVIRVSNDEETLTEAEPSIVEKHRDAMIQQLARRDIGRFSEHTIFQKTLYSVGPS